MTISADELARLRDYVPETWTPTDAFDDTAVSAAWDRDATTEPDDTEDEDQVAQASLANVYRIAAGLTRQFLARQLADPDSFGVGGEYQESRGAALNMLRSQITDLEAKAKAAAILAGSTGRATAEVLVRPNYYGR